MKSKKVIGIISLIIGLILLIFCFTAGSVGIGSSGFGIRKAILLTISILLISTGLILFLSMLDKNIKDHYFFSFISKQSIIVYLLLGFFIAYVIFFTVPIFLNPQLRMQFPAYVDLRQRGNGSDLMTILDSCRFWIVNNQTPYFASNIYPPFTWLFFIPFIFLSYLSAYTVFIIMGLICLLITTILIPINIFKGKENTSAFLAFCFITGLFSYGFQFELERGQFNLIAFTFCLLAIYIFHYKKKYRLIAYGLLTISIQLKIYPAIFALLFIEDWGDWKANLKRLSGLFVLNFLMLFILGFNKFIEFINVTKGYALEPSKGMWVGNHSISSFFSMLASSTQLQFLKENGWYLPFLSYLILFASILFVVYLGFKQKREGLNTDLLLVCAIGALIIPSLSHDYTLSILPAVIAIALCGLPIYDDSLRNAIQKIIILIVSFAYSSTLFSYTNKPLSIGNNFPELMILLVSFVVLAAMRNKRWIREK